MSEFNSASVTALQKSHTAGWHESDPAVTQSGFAGLVESNHQQNFLLWHEEDVARRNDLGPERIMQAKRAIDGYNQARNNFIEQIDKFLVEQLSPATEGVPFNSETPGMMIDRLSILSLKDYHMAEEVARDDASDDHIAACQKKLETIKRQISDLSLALDELLRDVASGTRSFRVYFQFKMYNDPSLNPQLRDADQKTS